MFFQRYSDFFVTLATLFILLGVGFIGGKTKIIDGVASKKLSALIIKIGQPAMIIHSIIKMDYTAENMAVAMQTVIFGFAVHIFMAVVAFFIYIRFKNIDERKLSEFSTIFGNVGFLGIPILESLFDARGAFMGAFMLISFNVFLWTWGICIMARKRKDIRITPKKLLNFGTVPCMIGVILYFGCKPFFDFPAVIMNGLSYTASLCTPISMLIIGALLATRTAKQIFGSGKIYLLSAIKLLGMPLLVSFVMKLIGLPPDWIMFAAAITAMPSATTVTMLAELYDIDPGYSAQAVGTTSLFSIVTMPCVMFLAEKIVALW